jgi:predicted metal-dependent peptidase
MATYGKSGLSPEMERTIISARVRMLISAPFFGTLATRLIIKKAGDWCPTFATDGKYLYVNPEFMKELDKHELEFVVGHEVMHCVYDHMGRRGGRDPKLWNAAADFVINLELVDQNVGKMPKMGLLDEKYRGLSSDEVYELLEEEQDKNGDQGYETLDVHMEPNSGGGDGDGDGDATNGPISISEEERKALSDEIKQAVMEAAKAAGAGNVPGGVKRMIKDLVEPEMDWRELLQAELPSMFKDDFTFSRPSRKNSSLGGIYLPGQDQANRVECAIAIDTSGSIGESMLRDFISEIKGIMDQFDDFVITMWFFDTQTYTVHKFNPDNLHDILEVEIEGGGGTDFVCNFDLMKEMDLVPEKYICFTDGFPWDSWGDPDYCSTIFVVHGSPDITAPFGQTVYYDHKKEGTTKG